MTFFQIVKEQGSLYERLFKLCHYGISWYQIILQQDKFTRELKSHVKQDCKSPGKEQANFQICTVALIHTIPMPIYFLMHYFSPYISSFLPYYLNSIICLSTKLENRHLCLKIYDAGSIIHSLIHSLHSINVFQILLGTRNSDKFEDNDAEKGPVSLRHCPCSLRIQI